MKQTLLTAIGVAALAVTASLCAQTFPAKPITIVVPASSGSAIDLAARLIGQKMTASWGQSVVIDNKAGANGVIGTDRVAKAAPDGYTLALVASSHAINPSVMKKLPFDTVKSFEPVALTHIVPLALVVAPSLPVKSVKELIAYGKAHPGELSFASSGSGGVSHFSGELFKTMARLDLTHIPYKASTLAHPDLISGLTALMFDTVEAVNVQIKAHRVRPLAVTTARRSSILPDVPTMAEAGMPGFETSNWGGLLAPAGTPRATVAQLNAEVNRILALPDVRKTLQEAGIEPGSGTPGQFAEFISAEMTRWARIAQGANLQPE